MHCPSDLRTRSPIPQPWARPHGDYHFSRPVEPLPSILGRVRRAEIMGEIGCTMYPKLPNGVAEWAMQSASEASQRNRNPIGSTKSLLALALSPLGYFRQGRSSQCLGDSQHRCSALRSVGPCHRDLCEDPDIVNTRLERSGPEQECARRPNLL